MRGGDDKGPQQVHDRWRSEGTPRKGGVSSTMPAAEIAKAVRDQHEENRALFHGGFLASRFQRRRPVELVEGQVCRGRANRPELLTRVPHVWPIGAADRKHPGDGERGGK